MPVIYVVYYLAAAVKNNLINSSSRISCVFSGMSLHIYLLAFFSIFLPKNNFKSQQKATLNRNKDMTMLIFLCVILSKAEPWAPKASPYLFRYVHTYNSWWKGGIRHRKNLLSKELLLFATLIINDSFSFWVRLNLSSRDLDITATAVATILRYVYLF